MKEHVNVIKDSFIDFAGKKHYFVIAAVTVPTELTTEVYVSDEEDAYFDNYIEKCVSIGYSICNPEDQYDEKVGILKAIGRARNADPVLYTADGNLITNFLIESLLKQEARYLKNNPNEYIPGYNEAKERYLKNQKMKEIKDNFSEVERIIVDNVQKDPRFLDNVNEYLKWLKPVK